MKRGHTQRESKVLCQQLCQVEVNDGVMGRREERRGKLVECGKKEGAREGTKVNPIQL